jgi:hypothetical protein
MRIRPARLTLKAPAACIHGVGVTAKSCWLLELNARRSLQRIVRRRVGEDFFVSLVEGVAVGRQRSSDKNGLIV